MRRLPLALILALALAACAEKPSDGVYVDISLENKEGINSYIVFNPNIKTLDECQSSMEKALPAIMANPPEAVPRGSKATGFKCYLTDPREN